jgi:hypothetical protein
LETSASFGLSLASERLVTLPPVVSSSCPKHSVKATCWSSVMSWPGKTRTAYRSMPCSIAAMVAGSSGSRASTPVTRPTKPGPICSIWIDGAVVIGVRSLLVIR